MFELGVYVLSCTLISRFSHIRISSMHLYPYVPFPSPPFTYSPKIIFQPFTSLSLLSLCTIGGCRMLPLRNVHAATPFISAYSTVDPGWGCKNLTTLTQQSAARRITTNVMADNITSSRHGPPDSKMSVPLLEDAGQPKCPTTRPHFEMPTVEGSWCGRPKTSSLKTTRS